MLLNDSVSHPHLLEGFKQKSCFCSGRGVAAERSLALASLFRLLTSSGGGQACCQESGSMWTLLASSHYASIVPLCGPPFEGSCRAKGWGRSQSVTNPVLAGGFTWLAGFLSCRGFRYWVNIKLHFAIGAIHDSDSQFAVRSRQDLHRAPP